MPLDAGHHHIGIVAPAIRTHQPLRPIENDSLGPYRAAISAGSVQLDGRNSGTRRSRVAPEGGTAAFPERHQRAGMAALHHRRYRPDRGGA